MICFLKNIKYKQSIYIILPLACIMISNIQLGLVKLVEAFSVYCVLIQHYWNLYNNER